VAYARQVTLPQDSSRYAPLRFGRSTRSSARARSFLLVAVGVALYLLLDLLSPFMPGAFTLDSDPLISFSGVARQRASSPTASSFQLWPCKAPPRRDYDPGVVRLASAELRRLATYRSHP
jgi:hypothetical protein